MKKADRSTMGAERVVGGNEGGKSMGTVPFTSALSTPARFQQESTSGGPRAHNHSARHLSAN